MKFRPSHAWLGLVCAVVLLAGCRTSRPTASIGVTSPPPPVIGSTPIAAYDEYAWAVAPAEKIHVGAIAQAESR